MKILVTGSRHLEDFEYVKRVFSSITDLFGGTAALILIHGGANGADTLAAAAAKFYNWEVKAPYYPDWDKYGKAAGPIRNKKMLYEENPDIVLAFWNGTVANSGTFDMMEQAIHKRDCVLFVYPTNWLKGVI